MHLAPAPLIGAALACSGAGALNQLMERRADSEMDRTRFRPLPARRVTPTHAFAIGAALALGGVTYLAATTNALTAAVSAATLSGYLFCYTPLKRSTPHSTLVGAVPGALPPVMGWTAAANAVGSALASMLIYVLMAVVLVWKPTGLMGSTA